MSRVANDLVIWGYSHGYSSKISEYLWVANNLVIWGDTHWYSSYMREVSIIGSTLHLHCSNMSSILILSINK